MCAPPQIRPTQIAEAEAPDQRAYEEPHDNRPGSNLQPKRAAFRRARRFRLGVNDLTRFSAGYQQGDARFMWIDTALARHRHSAKRL